MKQKFSPPLESDLESWCGLNGAFSLLNGQPSLKCYFLQYWHYQDLRPCFDEIRCFCQFNLILRATYMCTHRTFQDRRYWSGVVHVFMDPQDCPHQKNDSICRPFWLWFLLKNACLSFTEMQLLWTRREMKALLTMILSFPLLSLACIRHAKCSLACREMLTRTRDIRGEWNKEKI